MSALSVTVLGCSGSYPGPGAACSGYLVRGPGAVVWVDAGSGTLAELQRHVTLAELDAIVLTHEHPDHWTDLQVFAVASHYILHLAPIPVLAPAGLRDRFLGPSEPLVWTEIAEGARQRVGGLELGFSRTDHGPETLAVRVDGGDRALGYSADSGPGWSLEALGPGLDLALCEATYLEEKEGVGHMTAAQAGETGRAARVGRLVITHLLPTVERDRAEAEASEAFGAPVTAVTQGMVLAV